MGVAPGWEAGEVVQEHVRARVGEHRSSATTGEHRDRRDPAGECAFDVVHVIADVHRSPVPVENLTLLRAPSPAFDGVNVETKVVNVKLGVGLIFARDDDDPPPMAAYGEITWMSRDRLRDRPKATDE